MIEGSISLTREMQCTEGRYVTYSKDILFSLGSKAVLCCVGEKTYTKDGIKNASPSFKMPYILYTEKILQEIILIRDNSLL